MKKAMLPFVLSLAFLGLALTGCGDDNDGCPGSIIASCTDDCPEDCDSKGMTEVCVGAGYEPNRCCYCE